MSGSKIGSAPQSRGIGGSHNLTRAADLAHQGKPYVLQKGESKGLWGIAQQLASVTGRSVNDLKNQLLKDNGLTEESARKLKPGTEIKLPDLSKSSQAEQAKETAAPAAPAVPEPTISDQPKAPPASDRSTFSDAVTKQRENLLTGSSASPSPQIPTSGMPTFRVNDLLSGKGGNLGSTGRTEVAPKPVEAAPTSPAAVDAAGDQASKIRKSNTAIFSRALEQVFPGDQKRQQEMLAALVPDAGRSGPGIFELATKDDLQNIAQAIQNDAASINGNKELALKFLSQTETRLSPQEAAAYGNILANQLLLGADVATR